MEPYFFATAFTVSTWFLVDCIKNDLQRPMLWFALASGASFGGLINC